MGCAEPCLRESLVHLIRNDFYQTVLLLTKAGDHILPTERRVFRIKVCHRVRDSLLVQVQTAFQNAFPGLACAARSALELRTISMRVDEPTLRTANTGLDKEI